jgi:hypothetical protein
MDYSHISEILQKVSNLYSQYYATWQNTNKPVRLSVSKLKSDFLFDEKCNIHTIETDILIGYVIYRTYKHPLGRICWITQLLIHPDYRNKGYAKHLIKKVSKDCDILGIASSNPYSIKAVQSVANTKYNYDFNLIHLNSIIQYSQVPYILNKQINIYVTHSIINTDFMINRIDDLTIQLPDGCEYIGVYKISKNTSNHTCNNIHDYIRNKIHNYK